MKRYLRRMLTGGAIVIMIVNMLVCSLVFLSLFKENARDSLKTVINAFVLLDTPDEEECPAIAAQISGLTNGLEVTFLREDGTIIASASGQDRQHGGIVNEPDIRNALLSDWGEDVRPSASSGVYTLYVAHYIGDGMILQLGHPMTAANSFLLILLTAGILTGIVLIALLHLATNRLTDRLLRPLRRINDLLHSTYSAQQPKISDPFEEVQPLMDNISSMIRKLHYDFEEISRTQQLRRDFVANASHELKSPLTSIRGFAELLQAGMGGTEVQQKEYLGRIIRESNRLLAIVEDVLRLNRAETRLPENVQAVDMRVVCDEAAQALESIAVRKNIRLDVAGHGMVRANSQEMWELVYNLMDNGIRYGRENGFVRVRIDHLGLTVTDNGIGMSNEQLPRIFERFYRVDNSHSRTGADGMPGGTGLGLSIVRHIARKYGGDVSVTSAPGEGSTFIVQLGEETEIR